MRRLTTKFQHPRNLLSRCYGADASPIHFADKQGGAAVAAKHLAPSGARTMAIISNGAQSEFQAIAFKALTGVDRLRLTISIGPPR